MSRGRFTSTFRQVSADGHCRGRSDSRPLPDYIKDKDAFVQLVQSEADTFRPPGERVASYAPNAVASSSKQKLTTVDFEIYRVRVATGPIVNR